MPIPRIPATLEALAVHGANQVGKLIDGVLPKLEKLEMRKAVRVRDLTLNETFDDYGRLIQLLGNNQVQDTVNGELEFGRAYDSEPTEVVRSGATEVWRIFNLTGDTHPMHFHLVNVQVISRQPFNDSMYLLTMASRSLPDRLACRTRMNLAGRDGANEPG
jgi:FtsP/CotA-like multicopper oxidase with cupredoxin domain